MCVLVYFKTNALLSSLSLVHNSSPLLSLAMQSAGHRLGLKPHKAGFLFLFLLWCLLVFIPFSLFLSLSLFLSFSLSLLCVRGCVWIGARDCEDKKILFGPCDIEGHGILLFPSSSLWVVYRQTNWVLLFLSFFFFLSFWVCAVGLDGRLYILDFARVQVLSLLFSSLSRSVIHSPKTQPLYVQPPTTPDPSLKNSYLYQHFRFVFLCSLFFSHLLSHSHTQTVRNGC